MGIYNKFYLKCIFFTMPSLYNHTLVGVNKKINKVTLKHR